MGKNFFNFKFFDELQVGDVFKFSPVIDSDIPRRFYTVYEKNEYTTKFNTTYGKCLYQNEFDNNIHKEVMIFPNRKSIYTPLKNQPTN